MNDRNQYYCPLIAPERRLFDSLDLWVETKKLYFQPDQFRINLNNTIQALRSVTFLLQKTKTNFPHFDEWYSKWQDTMRADPLMRWLVEARNIIVKEGDLATHSIARVSVVESWFDPAKFEMLVPPFIETEYFARILANTAPRGVQWDIGLLRVERRWVDSRLPKQEILETLVHSFKVLSQLLLDAHDKLIDEESRNTCPWFSSQNVSRGFLPPCMLGQHWDRTIWVNIRDGSVMAPEELPVVLTPDEFQEAKERYLGLEDVKSELTRVRNLSEEAAILFQHAKNVLRTDGYHLPIALLGYPDGKKVTVSIRMEDRTEKHLVFRGLANMVERTGATSVVIINEIWFSRRPTLFRHAVDDPSREEGLQLIAADETGKQYIHTSLFFKDKNGAIIFGDEFFSTEDTVNILRPVKIIWNRRRETLK